MDREIKIHQVPGEPNSLLAVATDEPGAGGANHEYSIITTNEDGELIELATISFQNGTVPENGVNGVTCELLLALVIDRLSSFQAGPYPCDENAAALGYAQHSLHWLQERTRNRIAAQVEGLSLAIPNEPLGVEIPEGAKSLADDELSEAAEAEAATGDLTQAEIDKLDEAIAKESDEDAKKETDGQTG